MPAQAIAPYRDSARSRWLDDDDIPYRKDLQRISDIRLAILVHERYSPQSFPEEPPLLSFEQVLALGALSGVLKDEATKTEPKERNKSEWLIDLSDSNATGEQQISGIPQGKNGEKNGQLLSLLDMDVEEEPESSALQPDASSARKEEDVMMMDLD